MKKNIYFEIISCVLALTTIFLSGCAAKNTSPSENLSISSESTTIASEVSSTPASPTADAVNTMGSTGENIFNGGLAAIQGDWIYYANDNAIWKMKTDGTENQQLCVAQEYQGSRGIGSINVVGNWVYFTNNGLLQKVKTDGTGFQTFDYGRTNNVLNFAGEIYVLGDWIYCISWPMGITPGMYYLVYFNYKTDGSEATMIGKTSSYSITVSEDGWIYYTSPEGGLYRMSTDGTQEHLVSSEITTVLMEGGPRPRSVNDGWLYYSERDDSGIIYNFGKIRTDGTGKQEIILDNGVSGINVAEDGWIYYIIRGDGLYKMREDGSEKQVIVAGLSESSSNDYYGDGRICVVGDWIYFKNYSYNRDPGDLYDTPTYRVKTDGTGYEEVTGTSGGQPTSNPSSDGDTFSFAENTYQDAGRAFRLFYESYANAINNQDIGLVEYCSANVLPYIQERLTVNADYIVTVNSVRIDRNSVRESMADGVPTVSALMQIDSMLRHRTTGATDTVTPVWSATAKYDAANGAWYIDQTERMSDSYRTIGANWEMVS